MPEPDGVLGLLAGGELSIEGRLLGASNATLYCVVRGDGVEAECVYKPVAGERPLWDFPDGTLAEREVAAHDVSAALGWGIVPPTVLRDGPAGPGMVQLWVDVDESVDLIGLLRSDEPQLRAVAVFDALINNGDRKGGHLLPTADGRVFGIDHGVSFSAENKLRTVLWQWAGEPLTDEALAGLEALRESQIEQRLEQLLTVREVRAFRRRLARLVSVGLHPEPSGDWPPVPYPPI